MRAVGVRLAKSIADLVPLDELAPGGVATGTTGAETTRVRATRPADPGAARRAGDDDRDDATPGPLPFTGLALLTLLLVGSALVFLGGRLRRSAAPAPPALAAAAPPTASPPPAPAPLAPAPPIRPHQSPALPLLALLGLATIAVLVVRPGRPS